MIGLFLVILATIFAGMLWAAGEHVVDNIKAKRQRNKRCACGRIILRGRVQVNSLTAVHDEHRCQPLWEVV